jgi:hypothetical protein
MNKRGTNTLLARTDGDTQKNTAFLINFMGFNHGWAAWQGTPGKKKKQQ